MRTAFRLVPDPIHPNHLFLPPSELERLGIIEGDEQTIRYGAESQLVRIAASLTLEPDRIRLSQEVMNRLRIPVSSMYELIMRGNEVRIGPIIGFLVPMNGRKMSSEIETILNEYVRCYQEINGVVVAFSLKGVNVKNGLINGFLYQPDTGKWEAGIFGYPSAFFILSMVIPNKALRHFQAVLGKSMFNDFYLSKWGMQKLLKTSNVRSALPPASLCQKTEDIQVFLDRHKSVYLKPINSSRGRGIIKIYKNGESVCVCSRVKGQNQENLFQSINSFREYASKHLAGQRYLMQKTVPLLKTEGRICDFRVVMVKDQDANWIIMGRYARLSAPESIVSNVSAGGFSEVAEHTLKRRFHLSNRQVENIFSRMAVLANQVGKVMDASGIHCGNMAVDIGVDRNYKLWIIEIQHNNPDNRTLLIDVNDRERYFKLLRYQMLYLKKLAGFEPNKADA